MADQAPRDPVRCVDCVHFRSAPYEAGREGCYLPANMSSKQTAAYLDEQQIPGDHWKINIRGDCADFEPRPERAPLWQRLFDLGA